MTSDQYSFFLRCDALIKNFRPKNICGIPFTREDGAVYINAQSPIMESR